MKPIEIKNSEKFKKDLESLEFIEVQDINGKYNIRCYCDDWFARSMNINLLGGFDFEDNKLILIEKPDLHYLNFEQLFKFLEVVKKYVK